MILRFDANALQQLPSAICGLCNQQQRSVQEELEQIWSKLQRLRKQQTLSQRRDQPKCAGRPAIAPNEAVATRQLVRNSPPCCC